MKSAKARPSAAERLPIRSDASGCMTLVKYWMRSGGGAAEKPSSRHGLFLIPWSIGNRLDISLNAVRCVRRLRTFLTEDPEMSREQAGALLGEDVGAKRFLRLPDVPDAGFLKTVRDLLKKEDLGLISCGGMPCFVDPGAWLVSRLRADGVPITPLAGASALSTVLSLSGIEWREHQVFSFAFFPDGSSQSPAWRSFLAAASRPEEPLVVFLDAKRFKECVRALAPVAGSRLLSAFFDLTRGPRQSFPHADEVRTMCCRDWLKGLARLSLRQVSDAALLLHPSSEKRS